MVGVGGLCYPRATYLLLVVDFLRRLLDLHDQLVDDVERELAAPGATEPAL